MIKTQYSRWLCIFPHLKKNICFQMNFFFLFQTKLFYVAYCSDSDAKMDEGFIFHAIAGIWNLYLLISNPLSWISECTSFMHIMHKGCNTHLTKWIKMHTKDLKHVILTSNPVKQNILNVISMMAKKNHVSKCLPICIVSSSFFNSHKLPYYPQILYWFYQNKRKSMLFSYRCKIFFKNIEFVKLWIFKLFYNSP